MDEQLRSQIGRVENRLKAIRGPGPQCQQEEKEAMPDGGATYDGPCRESMQTILRREIEFHQRRLAGFTAMLAMLDGQFPSIEQRAAIEETLRDAFALRGRR